MRDQELIGLYEAYKEVHRPTETTEELEYDTQSSYQDWVNQLVEEGYDLSNWTDEGLYELYYNEAYKGGPEFGIPYSEPKPLSGEKGDGSGYGGPEKFKKPDDNIEKPGTTVPKPKQGGYGRIMSNIPHGIGDHATPTQSRVSTITRKDPGAPTSQKLPPQEKTKPSREIIRKTNINASYDLYDIILSHLLDEGYDLSDYTQLDEISDELATAARNLRQKRYTKSADQARNLQLSKGNRADMFYKNFDKTVKLNDTLKSREKRTGTKIPQVEQLDLYDIILSHLIAEGYADTEQAAEAIMVNMSEEWRESIVETRSII